MAFPLTELATDQANETYEAKHDSLQDSMFDSASDFPGHDLVELPEDSQELFPSESVQYQDPEDLAHSPHELEMGIAAASPAYPNPDPDPAPEPEPIPDPDPSPQLAADASLASPDLPLTIADFAALEDRVLRAVSLVRRERQSRVSAEQRAEFVEGRAVAAEARITELSVEVETSRTQASALEQLQQEVDSLRQEREQVRQRVERLLGQLDALEL